MQNSHQMPILTHQPTQNLSHIQYFSVQKRANLGPLKNRLDFYHSIWPFQQPKCYPIEKIIPDSDQISTPNSKYTKNCNLSHENHLPLANFTKNSSFDQNFSNLSKFNTKAGDKQKSQTATSIQLHHPNLDNYCSQICYQYLKTSLCPYTSFKKIQILIAKKINFGSSCLNNCYHESIFLKIYFGLFYLRMVLIFCLLVDVVFYFLKWGHHEVLDIKVNLTFVDVAESGESGKEFVGNLTIPLSWRL